MKGTGTRSPWWRGLGVAAAGLLGTALFAPSVQAQCPDITIVKVAAGANHSVALRSDGLVFTWGSNSDGQLGDGTNADRGTPEPVLALADLVVVDVAAGGNHTLAVLSDGSVRAWGDNEFGQLGNGTDADSSVPVVVGTLDGVTAVAAGDAHSLALFSGGGVAAWGANADGQLGNGTNADSDVPVLASITGVTQIAAGGEHSLAVTQAGSVSTWGDNDNGQLGNGTFTDSDVPVTVSGLGSVTSIAGGGDHSLAVSGGVVFAWGDNDWGQLGNGTQTDSAVFVMAGGGLSSVTQVAAGEDFSLALRSDGRVFAWGRNDHGQIAGNDPDPSAFFSTPTLLNQPRMIDFIAAGDAHALAIRQNSQVRGWGFNAFGQVSESDVEDRKNPVDVNVPTSAIVLQITGPSEPICPGEATQLSTVYVVGGDGNYTYAWEPASETDPDDQPTTTATPDTTTNFTLTVTDGQGCTTTDNFVVNVDDPPTAEAGTGRAICENAGTVLGGDPTASGGASPYTYEWTPVAGLDDPTAANPVASPDATTQYTVLVTDAEGCTDTDVVRVGVLAGTSAPVANAGADQERCENGDPVTIGTAVTPADDAANTYAWSPTTGLDCSGCVGGCADCPQPEAAPDATTTYTLTVTNTASGCTSQDTVTVVVHPAPVADAGAPRDVCTGEQTVLGPTPVFTGDPDMLQAVVYTIEAGDLVDQTPNCGNEHWSNFCCWDPDPGFQWQDTIPANATVYSVTIESSFGTDCHGPDSHDATLNGDLIGSFTLPGQCTCGPDPVVRTLLADDTSYVIGGTNTFRYSATAQIGNSPHPTLDGFYGRVTVHYAVYGGTPPYTFEWTPATGLSATDVPNPTATVDATRTYTFTITDANGCEDSDSVTVTAVAGEAPADAGPDRTTCPGDPVAIGMTANAGDSYSWSPTTGLSNASSSMPMASPDVTTTYTLTVTDNATGCTAQDTVTVTVLDAPVADAGPDPEQLCPGESAQLQATAMGGTGPYAFSWTPTTGLSNPNVANPTATPADSTTYTVTVTDANGCTSTDQVRVNVRQNAPTADAGPDRLNCEGTGVTIGGNPTADGGKAPYTFSWTPSTGLSAANVANPTANPSQTTTYTVTVTDDRGCTDTDSVTVFAGTDEESDIDDDQAPDCVEVQEGIDPFVKDNDVFTDDRLFVMQQYRDFLGREGDEGGIQFWIDQINSGVTKAEVIEAFFFSQEFQVCSDPVTRLYFAYFLRIPDLGGLMFWIDECRDGRSLKSISDFFSQSQEFQDTYGSLTNSEFVDLVYQNVLGRDPDPAGEAFWEAELDSGRRSRGDMMLEFALSSEYDTIITNEVFVVQIYFGMLERTPDQGGFDFWVAQIDSSGSRLDIINGFFASDEYHDRFLP